MEKLKYRNDLLQEIYMNQTSEDIIVLHEGNDFKVPYPLLKAIEGALTVALGSLPPPFTLVGDAAVFAKALIVDMGRYFYATSRLTKLFAEYNLSITGYKYAFDPSCIDENLLQELSLLNEDDKQRIVKAIYDHLEILKLVFVSLISAIPDQSLSSLTAFGLSTMPVERLIIDGSTFVPDSFFKVLELVSKGLSLFSFNPVPFSVIINARKILKTLSQKSFSNVAKDAYDTYQDYQNKTSDDNTIDITPDDDDIIDVTPNSNLVSERKIQIFIEELNRLDRLARRKYKTSLVSMNLLESSSHRQDIEKEIDEVQDGLVVDLLDVLQRLIESTSIHGSSGLTLLAGAISQATVAKKFLLGLAHSYYLTAGEKHIRRRIVQFTPAAISALIGGPVGIMLSPFFGLLGNLFGDALTELGRSIELMGGIKDIRVSAKDQAVDALGDLFTGLANSASPINFTSMLAVAKNGFEIRSGTQKLRDLNLRLDSLIKAGGGTTSTSSGPTATPGHPHPIPPGSTVSGPPASPSSTPPPSGRIGTSMQPNVMNLPPGLPEID